MKLIYSSKKLSDTPGLKWTKVSKVKEFYLFYFYKKIACQGIAQKAKMACRGVAKGEDRSDTITLGTLAHFSHSLRDKLVKSITDGCDAINI